MGTKTEISWTDHTFNPWWGCVKVSPACDNCYAETFSKRVGFSETGSQFPIWGKDSQRRFFGDKHWAEPLKWNKAAEKEGVRKRVFCASMADVMEEHPDLQPSRVRLYNLIQDTPWLDWLLLTKRPQNFKRFLPKTWLANPRPNVWGMTTVESQEYMWRAKALYNTPFAVRGISAEPLLGPLDFTTVDYRDDLRQSLVKFARWSAEREGADQDEAEQKARKTISDGPMVEGETPSLNLLTGEWFDGWDSDDDGPKLHWIIGGGESGHGARPMHPDWARSLRDQCREAGVAFHFKQFGEHDSNMVRVGKKRAGRLLDGREWNEIPGASYAK